LVRHQVRIVQRRVPTHLHTHTTHTLTHTHTVPPLMQCLDPAVCAWSKERSSVKESKMLGDAPKICSDVVLICSDVLLGCRASLSDLPRRCAWSPCACSWLPRQLLLGLVPCSDCFHCFLIRMLPGGLESETWKSSEREERV